MDKPISVGDLVQVIRAAECCGKSDYLGHIFRVSDIRKFQITCRVCGYSDNSIMRATAAPGPDYPAFSLPRLKRIPPLSELPGVKTDEETYA